MEKEMNPEERELFGWYQSLYRRQINEQLIIESGGFPIILEGERKIIGRLELKIRMFDNIPQKKKEGIQLAAYEDYLQRLAHTLFARKTFGDCTRCDYFEERDEVNIYHGWFCLKENKYCDEVKELGEPCLKSDEDGSKEDSMDNEAEIRYKIAKMIFKELKEGCKKKNTPFKRLPR